MLVGLLPVVASATPSAHAAVASAVPVAAPYGIVMTQSPRQLDLPGAGRHAAFPGLVAADGALSLVWRAATDHAATRDGRSLRATSIDEGRTYLGPTTELELPGKDVRDPYLSVVGEHEFLTFFTGSAATPGEGAFVSRDGGTPVRISNLAVEAISGPVVQLPNGDLGTAIYGRLPGEIKDTAWFAWSSDEGQTWTSKRVLNPGVESTPEPWLVVDGGTLHMFARWGTKDIAMTSSTNSGQTWGTPRIAAGSCTGRPSTFLTQAGQLVMICRDARPGREGAAQVALSVDHGQIWHWGPTIAPYSGGIGMAYAGAAEVLPGVLAVVVSMERADGSAGLCTTYLAEAVRWPTSSRKSVGHWRQPSRRARSPTSN